MLMANVPAILGLATGVPQARYGQRDIAEYFSALQTQDPRRARAIRFIFDRAGVGFRHMIIDEHFYTRHQTTQERNDLYMKESVPLGEKTIRKGLEAAGVHPDEISDFIVVSCTGMRVPGLDLLLAARLGMRHDLQRTCVLGMGCYGAFPGLRLARQSVLDQPGRLALVLSLELCSPHMQMVDTTESVVSSALFADGAAMALVADEKREMSSSYKPRLLRSVTFSDYTTLDHMTFDLTDQGFRMYLSGYVPDLLAAQIEPFVSGLLASHDLKSEDVRFWGIHPGSSKIVDYVQDRLKLADEQVEFSHQILYEYGNMSSPTILFVLDRIQECGHPDPGDYGVLVAFGPGLTMEGLLVQW
jgi:predicted naringenin-chalcone synthase